MKTQTTHLYRSRVLLLQVSNFFVFYFITFLYSLCDIFSQKWQISARMFNRLWIIRKCLVDLNFYSKQSETFTELFFHRIHNCFLFIYRILQGFVADFKPHINFTWICGRFLINWQVHSEFTILIPKNYPLEILIDFK